MALCCRRRRPRRRGGPCDPGIGRLGRSLCTVGRPGSLTCVAVFHFLGAYFGMLLSVDLNCRQIHHANLNVRLGYVGYTICSSGGCGVLPR